MGDSLAPTPSTQVPATSPTKLPKLVTPRRRIVEVIGFVIAIQIAVTVAMFLTSTASTWIVLGAMMLATAVWGRWSRARTRSQIAANDIGREQLESGDLDQAAAVLDKALGQSPRHVGVFILLAHHRALVSLHRGDFIDARARYGSILTSGWLTKRRMLNNLAPGLYAGAAMASALEGDLDDALAMQRAGKGHGSSLARYWYVCDAIILARTQRFPQLLRELDEHREAAEGTITGVSLRRLQLLEAFATHELAKGEDEYRGLHSGADIKAMLHGIRPGRLDPLAQGWPQLREFMSVYGLLAS